MDVHQFWKIKFDFHFYYILAQLDPTKVPLLSHRCPTAVLPLSYWWWKEMFFLLNRGIVESPNRWIAIFVIRCQMSDIRDAAEIIVYQIITRIRVLFFLPSRGIAESPNRYFRYPMSDVRYPRCCWNQSLSNNQTNQGSVWLSVDHCQAFSSTSFARRDAGGAEFIP